MESKWLKAGGLGLLGLGAVAAAVVFWPETEVEEEPKDELEELTAEFIDIKCSRGTHTDQARPAEERTQEIMARIKEMREEKEDSEEQKKLELRMLDLIEPDCSQPSDS